MINKQKFHDNLTDYIALTLYRWEKKNKGQLPAPEDIEDSKRRFHGQDWGKKATCMVTINQFNAEVNQIVANIFHYLHDCDTKNEEGYKGDR